MKKLMKWVRNEDKLHLEILVDGVWKNYKDSSYVTADAAISSNSGYATAQKCLQQGFKYMRVIEVVEFLEHKTVEELAKEVQDSITLNQPVELNLVDADSVLMNKLYEFVDIVRTNVELALVKDLVSFSNGLTLYRCVMQDYLVSECDVT